MKPLPDSLSTTSTKISLVIETLLTSNILHPIYTRSLCCYVHGKIRCSRYLNVIIDKNMHNDLKKLLYWYEMVNLKITQYMSHPLYTESNVSFSPFTLMLWFCKKFVVLLFRGEMCLERVDNVSYIFLCIPL